MGGRGSSSSLAGRDRKIGVIESMISGQSTETAYVFDGEGNTIFSKTDGAKDYVTFSSAQLEQMNGKILTHNHPSGSSFSKDDLKLLYCTGLQEIRAATKQGVFIMSRSDFSENSNSNQMVENYVDAVENFKKTNLDKKYDEMVKRLKDYQITIGEFRDACNGLNAEFKDYQHEWLSRNASTYGYTYKFERRN